MNVCRPREQVCLTSIPALGTDVQLTQGPALLPHEGEMISQQMAENDPLFFSVHLMAPLSPLMFFSFLL